MKAINLLPARFLAVSNRLDVFLLLRFFNVYFKYKDMVGNEKTSTSYLELFIIKK